MPLFLIPPLPHFLTPEAHKPVIAILAVQPPNGELKLYRGTNMEVSMPTGSLCAERNVIGTALGKITNTDFRWANFVQINLTSLIFTPISG